MLKNTKDIIFSNFFFPIIPMGLLVPTYILPAKERWLLGKL